MKQTQRHHLHHPRRVTTAWPAVAGTVCIIALASAVGRAQQAGEYVIGPQDVLNITVLNQAGLGGKYAVELDGSFSFPLIGRLKASGMTLPVVETELRKRLAAGFFNNPEITVAIEQYRSQRIYVIGEVRTPGAYPLAGDMTLFEALARAGSMTMAAGDELVIIRARHTGSPDAVSVAQEEAVHVSLEDLQGIASTVRTVELRDGDTIYIPRAPVVYVFGEVKNPGSYPTRRSTTVLQALSLAGGMTPLGAAKRVNVMRVVDGTTKEFKVKLSDLIQPGDTIVVPERFF